MNNKKAFTLIELLIAIAIIGILSSTGFMAFGSAQKKARDAQRKNDLNQVKKALIAARSDCTGGYYPIGVTGALPDPYTDTTAYSDLMTYLTSQNYMKVALNDPRSYSYAFAVNPASTVSATSVCPSSYDGTSVFVLRAQLELGTNDPDTASTYSKCSTIITSNSSGFTWTGTSPSATDGYYYVCSN